MKTTLTVIKADIGSIGGQTNERFLSVRKVTF